MSTTTDQKRLERVARTLGLELPLFDGPLVAFVLGGERSTADRVYLGGDLHATHPQSKVQRLARGLDRSLDAAGIAITDFERQPVETTALDGIWCVALRGAILDSAPYLAVTDTQGRRRVFVLLPSPRAMIGMGHYWLPRIPPASGS